MWPRQIDPPPAEIWLACAWCSFTDSFVLRTPVETWPVKSQFTKPKQRRFQKTAGIMKQNDSAVLSGAHK